MFAAEIDPKWPWTTIYESLTQFIIDRLNPDVAEYGEWIYLISMKCQGVPPSFSLGNTTGSKRQRLNVIQTKTTSHPERNGAPRFVCGGRGVQSKDLQYQVLLLRFTEAEIALR